MISATVAGYLGADPELAAAGQSQVLRFRVASTSKRGDKETTTWVGCSWFGKRAVNTQKYLTKGTAVVVSGTLTTTEKDGRTYVNLDVADLKRFGGPSSGSSRGSDTPRELENNKQNVDEDDSSLPF